MRKRWLGALALVGCAELTAPGDGMRWELTRYDGAAMPAAYSAACVIDAGRIFLQTGARFVDILVQRCPDVTYADTLRGGWMRDGEALTLMYDGIGARVAHVASGTLTLTWGGKDGEAHEYRYEVRP